MGQSKFTTVEHMDALNTELINEAPLFIKQKGEGSACSSFTPAFKKETNKQTKNKPYRAKCKVVLSHFILLAQTKLYQDRRRTKVTFPVSSLKIST